MNNIKKKFEKFELGNIERGDLPDDMPLDFTYYKKFCELNPNIMLQAYVENPSGNVPVQLFFEGNNNLKNEDIIILFLGKKGESGLYVYIKIFNNYLFNVDKYRGHKKVWCDQCKTYRLASSKPCKHLKMKGNLMRLTSFAVRSAWGPLKAMMTSVYIITCV